MPQLKCLYEAPTKRGPNSTLGQLYMGETCLWAMLVQFSDRAKYVTFIRDESGWFRDMVTLPDNNPDKLRTYAAKLNLPLVTDSVGGLMYKE